MNLYPDDHRCSDQETDGGLCGCMMIQSGSEEEEDYIQQMSASTSVPSQQRRDEDDSYTRRLFLARNRKILQQSVHTRTSSLDDHASVSTTQPGQSTLPTRSVASDPIDKTIDDDDIMDAFPSLSSPLPQRPRYSPSKSLRASTSTLNGAQSAARKSISNVYERLLREEEERRESERVRKEQARQRRRVERLRKQEDSEMLARLISNTSTSTNVKDMMENGDEMQMPPYTSPILAVSPPSTRDVSFDVRTNLLQEENRDMDEMHANGHLHPAHAFGRSTNAAKLAAVRAANMIEETRENDSSTPSIIIPSLGLAPAFAQEGGGKVNGSVIKAEEQYSSSPLNASPASSVDSVLSWTFPNRTSPTASPQLLSPNLNTFSPQINNQNSSSSRRNRHRRGTHGEGGVSQVLSLSARVPSLNAAKTAAKVKKELYSPDPELPNSPGHFSITQEEQEALLAEKSHEDVPISQGKRRVSFSPKPEFITTFTPVAEEGEEEEEDNDNNTDNSIPTIRIPDEIVEEVTEGSENSRVAADVPLQSTPPRKKRNSGSDRSNSTMNAPNISAIGDDSLRLTLEQLNKFLKDREEKKDLTALTQDITIKSEPEKASIVQLSITDLTDSSKDEEYVRQLNEARERLNRIARSYTGTSKPYHSNTSTFKITIFLIGICIVQIGLAILMNAAAQAKAEEMYLTIHYGYLSGFEEILLFETQAKSSLFAPLFTQWGILPDLGRLAVGDRDELLNDWMSTFGWIWRNIWQYKTIWQPIRFTFAKLAYSLGLYGVNTVPIGGMIPS